MTKLLLPVKEGLFGRRVVCHFWQALSKTIWGAKMHGSGAAEQYMDAFNKTLWDELAYSGQIQLAPKTSYPLQLPQQPSDFKPPVMFSDWTRPPVSANYLAFG